MTPVVIFLFLAFIVVPVLEIALITQVAGGIGWLSTIVLVIGVSMAGALLVKREGLGVIKRVQESLRSGRLPTNDLADGAMIFFASALMLTPGFLTDGIGLALLIPPIRALLRPPVISFFKKRVDVKTSGMASGLFGGAQGPMGPRPRRGGDVFDVDARRTAQDAEATDITKPPPELDG